jgi:hypothetical protein
MKNENAKRCTIKSGALTLSADPDDGGKIISFKHGNFEFLTQKDVCPEGYGSTLWPSPQSEWNWPPPMVLDREPYSFKINNDSITLTSGCDPVSGLQLTKEFISGKENSVKLSYKIINQAEKTKKVALWEVSRVQKGGLLFYPKGNSAIGKKCFPNAEVSIMDGIIWFDATDCNGREHKLNYGDGEEGWLAYLIDSRLFIKKYLDSKPEEQAPGEGEVSFYIDSTSNFIELELQGRYKELLPATTLNFETIWIAAELPSFLTGILGDSKLVDFVRAVVSKY